MFLNALEFLELLVHYITTNVIQQQPLNSRQTFISLFPPAPSNVRKYAAISLLPIYPILQVLKLF